MVDVQKTKYIAGIELDFKAWRKIFWRNAMPILTGRKILEPVTSKGTGSCKDGGKCGGSCKCTEEGGACSSDEEVRYSTTQTACGVAYVYGCNIRLLCNLTELIPNACIYILLIISLYHKKHYILAEFLMVYSSVYFVN